MVHDLGCCGAMCTCNTRAICDSSDFGKFGRSDVKIWTMIKFHDCFSTVNDTGWWGASCTCARATFIDAFLVKESTLLNLNIATGFFIRTVNFKVTIKRL